MTAVGHPSRSHVWGSRLTFISLSELSYYCSPYYCWILSALILKGTVSVSSPTSYQSYICNHGNSWYSNVCNF